MISVIVTTCNHPDALNLVLKFLAAQKGRSDFEVLIADDGSGDGTKTLT